jgi:D-sedoheptulose 7-phosphate isomerase
MTTVFTNGCFDLIHPGHIDLLERARALGTRLVVGINSDSSVRAIRGDGRPILGQEERATILRGLRSVDEVRIYDEPTPARLIEEVAPDVLVKGGDWPVDQIVGAEFVLGRGGKVLSLPLVAGHSSTGIVERVRKTIGDTTGNGTPPTDGGHGLTAAALTEHLEVFRSLLGSCLPAIERCGDEIGAAFARGGKLLICGNGGSASDAQHLAAEFVVRYELDRIGLPAIALSTDTSALTAAGNDLGFERIFSRQVEALARPEDLVIGISTSGNSPNVIAAIMAAKKIGCRTVGLTGADGKRLASLCDHAVLAPSRRTSRIQEVHAAIYHIWCERVDRSMVQQSDARTGA